MLRVPDRRTRTMPRSSTALALALGTLVLAALGGPAGASAQTAATTCAGADTPHVTGNEALMRSAMLCLVNNERTSRGIPALAASPILDVAAQRHADDMVARSYFAHAAPAPAPFGATPAERATAAGYPLPPQYYSQPFVGENIAMSNATPRATTAQWMRSTGHCRAIVWFKHTEIGIGVNAGGAPFAPVWVQSFGNRDPEGTPAASEAPVEGCPYGQLVTPVGEPDAPPTPPTPATPTTPTVPTAPGAGTTTPKPKVTASARQVRVKRALRIRVTGVVTGSAKKVTVTVRRSRTVKGRVRLGKARRVVATVRRGRYTATLTRPSGRGTIVARAAIPGASTSVRVR